MPLRFDDPAALHAARPPLRAGQVQLWEVDLAAQAPCADFHTRLLSAPELARVHAMATPALAQDCRAARATLRLILAGYLGADPRELAFVLEPHGKPRLAPAHATDLEFNLAHSGSRALVAVSRAARVGVDIERRRPVPEWRELAAQLFTARELQHLLALPPEEGFAEFMNFWARKEAVIKCTGEGLARPLDSFDVTAAPGIHAWALQCGDAGPGALAMRTLDVDDDYAACLAVEGGHADAWFVQRRHGG